MAYQSWVTNCGFDGCKVHLLPGQGHYVRDPKPRALCDHHFVQVQQMRKNARRRKRLSALQPSLFTK